MPHLHRAMAIALLCALLLFAAGGHAIAPTGHGDHSHAIMPMLRVQADRLEVSGSLLLEAQRDTSLLGRTTPFLQQHGHDWDIRWDSRGDRAAVVQGSGIALIPGKGNALRGETVALSGDAAADLPVVAELARAFVIAQTGLLAAQDLELHLDLDRSTAFGADNERWFLEFQQHHNGVPIDGAFVFVRIAHGNIVQFGSERIGNLRLSGTEAFPDERRFEQTWAALNFPQGTQIVEWLERGEARIYPVLPPDEAVAHAYQGVRGGGYQHVRAWRYVFRVDDHATWQVLVNADDGRIFDVRDLTLHVDATVSGGVYPSTNTDPQVIVEFPFTAVSNNGNKITNIDGVYDYSGGTASSTLNGRYFRMQDNCGSISLSNSTDGTLNFGTSGGTDCTTPGVGGSGNTHASRTGFYHLTLINAKARSILPSNTWLQSTVTSNMNINNQCNATWNGSAVNFYRSGGGCSNTGEIAAVFLHEWGHGLDQNTGGTPASDRASGEAVGDTFAFLETRDACIGPNFRPGAPCHNCGTCTGVRDVGVFAQNGPRPNARPDAITNSSGIACGRYSCPYSTPQGAAYRGPMGYQGHCESLIASSANWDLKEALVGEFGESGWGRMDHIWYGSLVPSKSAYQVASGGQCNPSATVNGCGATNWYTVYLAVDDDDGNLANGTPNGCRIWDAFDAHGIACGARPVCTESGGTGDFGLDVATPEQTICPGDSAGYLIDVQSVDGFSAPVTLAVTGVPGAASPSFLSNPVTPGQSSQLTIANTGALSAGAYSMLLNGTASGSDGHQVGLTLMVDPAVTAPPTLVAPADQAIDVGSSPLLQWTAVAHADRYRVELALDSNFSQVVVQQGDLITPQWQASGLEPYVRYYWRVIAENGCGSGPVSETYSFLTQTPRYQVGGRVTGLLGTGVALSLNGQRPITILADGEFQFPALLTDGSRYEVTIAMLPTQPAQQCRLQGGQGVISGAHVDTVQVTCIERIFYDGFESDEH